MTHGNLQTPMKDVANTAVHIIGNAPMVGSLINAPENAIGSGAIRTLNWN